MPAVERDHHRLKGTKSSVGATKGVATGIRKMQRVRTTIDHRLIENLMMVAMTSLRRKRKNLLLKRVAKSKFENGFGNFALRHQNAIKANVG